MAEHVASTEIGDNFSPLKHTIRDLADDFNCSPSGEAWTNCASKTVQNNALLRKAGLLKTSLSIRDLRALITAARAIAVLREEDSDLVAPGFEFLFEKPTASKPECLAAISKLLELAHLKKVDDLGIGASITKANQKVFIKAVTARAMDAQVIAKIDSSGVSNEWASATIYAANEDKQIRVQHVTAFLTKQGEWVFGDYLQGLSKKRLRLLMRQFHRVLASLLDRVLAPSEVARFSKKARKTEKWATNAEDFQQIIDDIVELSRVPLEPVPSKSKKQKGDSDISSAPGSMSAFNADGTASETGYMSTFDDAGDLQIGQSGRRGAELAPLEVADWLSAQDIQGFDNFRCQWALSGRMVADLKPEAIMRSLKAMGMGVAMAFEVFDKLASLPQAFIPAPAPKHVSWQGFSSHNFDTGRGQGEKRASTSPDPRAGAVSGAEQGFSSSFGSGARLVSLFQVQIDVKQAKCWLGCSTLTLANGQPCFGRVVGLNEGPPLSFVIKEDRVGGAMVSWSLDETHRALVGFRDFHSVIPNQPADTSSLASAVDSVGRAKGEIRRADKAMVDAALDEAYDEMRRKNTFDGLGFGPNGMKDGKLVREMWNLLRAGGQGFRDIVNHKAVQWVLTKVMDMLREKEVSISYDKLSRVVFHVGGRESLNSLTCLNPSKKTGGITKDHPERVQRVGRNDDGSLGFQTVEEDHRIKKDWDTFGFSRITFKKLFDVWEIVHSRHLIGNWWHDVDNLLEDLLILTGPSEVIDPMDVLMSLIWDSMPTLITTAIDEACAQGVAPWEVLRHSKIEPPSWARKRDRVIIMSSGGQGA